MIKDIIIHVWGGAIGAEAVLGRGSIPACAGEPEIIDSQSPRGKVYPRVGGGISLRTWALPRLVLIRSPCILVSSLQVRSRSSGERVSVRRALSSAIRFSSMFAWAESLSSIFSLVRSILPWGRVKEPIATGAGGDRATGCKGLVRSLPSPWGE